jgi:N-acetylglucosamine kinase-like BadF-type ATPase
MLPQARALPSSCPPRLSIMFVLGIDAGGTKTVCLLADGEGRVRATARGPGANLQTLGELEVEKVLHEVMDSVLADQTAAPSAICLGMAGVDRPHDNAIVRGIMRRIGQKAPVLVVNDALAALVAGAGEDGPAIVLIAGTGSICYGRNETGQAARSGGWGYLLGDEGSGWWIGQQALASVMRAADGRGPATRLTERVLGHFGFTHVSDLVHEIYYRETGRRSVAGLAGLVQTTADEADVVARQILSAAADELVLAVRSVATRLEMRGHQFPLVLSGSLFRVLPTLFSEVSSRLPEVAPRSQPRVLDVEPAVGAVRLALAEARGGARVPQYL